MKTLPFLTKKERFVKYLSLLFFVLFPFIGFYLGTLYQKSLVPPNTLTQPKNINLIPNEATNPTYPKATTKKVELPTVVDVTMQPLNTWTNTNFCGINFQISPEFETVTDSSNVETDVYCSKLYSYRWIEEDRFAGDLSIYIRVYRDYDGNSRRDFYMSKNNLTQANNYTESPSDEKYKGAINVTAGNNVGLLLEWFDPMITNLTIVRRVYLFVSETNDLIAIESYAHGNTKESDYVNMLITSLIYKK